MLLRLIFWVFCAMFFIFPHQEFRKSLTIAWQVDTELEREKNLSASFSDFRKREMEFVARDFRGKWIQCTLKNQIKQSQIMFFSCVFVCVFLVLPLSTSIHNFYTDMRTDIVFKIQTFHNAGGGGGGNRNLRVWGRKTVFSRFSRFFLFSLAVMPIWD